MTRPLSRRKWRRLSQAEKIELAGGPLDPYGPNAETLAEAMERLREAWRELGRAIVRAWRS